MNRSDVLWGMILTIPFGKLTNSWWRLEHEWMIFPKQVMGMMIWWSNLTGTMEFWMTFHKKLGISSSQLTFIFFRRIERCCFVFGHGCYTPHLKPQGHYPLQFSNLKSRCGVHDGKTWLSTALQDWTTRDYTPQGKLESLISVPFRISSKVQVFLD